MQRSFRDKEGCPGRRLKRALLRPGRFAVSCWRIMVSCFVRKHREVCGLRWFASGVMAWVSGLSAVQATCAQYMGDRARERQNREPWIHSLLIWPVERLSGILRPAGRVAPVWLPIEQGDRRRLGTGHGGR